MLVGILSLSAISDTIYPPYNNSVFLHDDVELVDLEDELPSFFVSPGIIINDGNSHDEYGFSSVSSTIALSKGLRPSAVGNLAWERYMIPVSVSKTGRYRISIKFTVEGVVFSPAADPWIGTSGASFDVEVKTGMYVDGADLCFAHSEDTIPLHNTELSLGAALTDVATEGFVALTQVAIGTLSGGSTYIMRAGEALTALSEISSILNLVTSGDSIDQRTLTMPVEADLQSGQQYYIALDLRNTAVAMSVSATAGIQLAQSMFNVNITEVTVAELLSSDPSISTLASSSSLVEQDGTFTLTAQTGGLVDSVYFYHDSNGNNVYDSSDGQIASDYSSAGGWSGSAVANYSIGRHTFFARAKSGTSWSGAASVAVYVDAGDGDPGSWISLYTTDWDDDDEDGVAEGYEVMDFRVKLKAYADIESVYGYLRSSVADMEIPEDEIKVKYPYWMKAGDKVWPYSRHNDIVLQRDSYNNLPLTLHVTYQKDGRAYYQDFTITKTFYKQGERTAAFAITDVIVDDSTEYRTYNNGDGLIQSGEYVKLKPRIKNIGSALATDVEAFIDIDSSAFEIEDDESYPDLDPGDSGYPLFDDSYSLGFNDIGTWGHFPVDVSVHWDQNDSPDPYVIADGLHVIVYPEAWLRVGEDYWDFGNIPPGDLITHTTLVENRGSEVLNVSGATYSHADINCPAGTFPFALPPKSSTNLMISIDTTGLQGQIERSITLHSDGRVRKPDEDDVLVVGGLVGNATPVYLIPDTQNAHHPSISGDWIVWDESLSNNVDIVAYNTLTGEKKRITTHSSVQRRPRISGCLIVWDDRRNNLDDAASNDIYGYDLSKPELGVFEVKSGDLDIDLWGVDNGHVVFCEDYEMLYEERDGVGTYTEDVCNMYVLQYDGSGGFIQKYTTEWAAKGGSDRSSRYTVDDENRLQVIKEGLLYFIRYQKESYQQSDGDWRWDNVSREYLIMDIAGGEFLPTSVGAARDRATPIGNRSFLYTDDFEDANEWSADEIFKWNNGSVSRLTSPTAVEDDRADDFLVGSSSYAMYDKRDSTENVYYLKLSDESEHLLTDQLANVDTSDVSADKNKFVCRAQNPATSEYVIYYAFIEQADISVGESDIILSFDDLFSDIYFDCSVKVNNGSGFDASGEIAIDLYLGVPGQGGVILGSQSITGLVARAISLITFSNLLINVSGEQVLYAQIGYDTDYQGNNGAARTITVLPKPCTLLVMSPYGLPDPLSSTYDQGASLTCRVPQYVESGRSRYVCEGWTMTEHEPSSGTSNSFSMIITNDASLTWLWSTNYNLMTEVSGNGSLDISNGWKTNGEVVVIAASNSIDFAVWSGDIPIGHETDNPLTMTMDSAKSIKAYFNVLLSVSNGFGDGTYIEGSNITIIANSPPRGQVFDVWTGDVEDVANINHSSTTVTMPDHDITLTATYKDAPRFAVSISAGSHGGVSPEGEVEAYQGESLLVTADPDGGYKVKHWLVNDEEQGKGRKELTVEITEPTVIQVLFEKIKAMPWLHLLLE